MERIKKYHKELEVIRCAKCKGYTTRRNIRKVLCDKCAKEKSRKRILERLKERNAFIKESWVLKSEKEKLEMINDFTKKILLQYDNEAEEEKTRLQKYRDRLYKIRKARKCIRCKKTIRSPKQNKSNLCNKCINQR